MSIVSAFRSIGALLVGRRQALIAIAASGINQIFGSATNLLIGIYLVRHMLPPEFGLYNIAFAVTITVAAIGNSVFLIPMTVGVPHEDTVVRNRFLLNHISTSAICIIFAGIVFALIVFALFMTGLFGIEITIFTLATICSSIGFFLKDAIVQAGYNQGRELVTILINVTSAASISLLIAISAVALEPITAPWAILGYAISQYLAVIVGYALVFGRMPLPTLSIVSAISRKVLSRGFWPACASTLALLRTQAHTVVVAGLIGPAGVGAINASRLMFAPVQMAQPALVRALMPRLVRQLRVDKNAFKRSTLIITFGLGLLSFSYCGFVNAIGPWIFTFVVGENYQYSSLMLLAWGCYVTMVALRSGLELNQQALLAFKGLALANLPASAVSLVGALALTHVSGPPGAVLGLALGEATIIALLVIRLRISN